MPCCGCERSGHSLKDRRQTVPMHKFFFNHNSWRKVPVDVKGTGPGLMNIGHPKVFESIPWCGK